jgi:hypothetical protein
MDLKEYIERIVIDGYESKGCARYPLGRDVAILGIPERRGDPTSKVVGWEVRAYGRSIGEYRSGHLNLTGRLPDNLDFSFRPTNTLGVRVK